MITVAAVSDQINPTLARLLDDDVQTTLLNGNSTEILTALLGSSSDVETQSVEGAVVGTFTIRNEHGLHARPSANLVNEVKKFASKITVQNLTRETAPVSAKKLNENCGIGCDSRSSLTFCCGR